MDLYLNTWYGLKYLHFTLKQFPPPPPPRVIYIREVQNLFNVLLVELGGKNYF